MAEGICAEDGCQQPARARGWCFPHYGKVYRAGAIPPRAPNGYTDFCVTAMTLTCPTHGSGVRARVRKRKNGDYLTCRKCDRGSRGGPARRARERRQRKYGLSDAEHQIMVQSQAGRCLICQEVASLVVDHDHLTGLVRGLLCHRCNVALGWMNDKPENFVRAARYLRRKIA